MAGSHYIVAVKITVKEMGRCSRAAFGPWASVNPAGAWLRVSLALLERWMDSLRKERLLFMGTPR